jgi:hypothetical protein
LKVIAYKIERVSRQWYKSNNKKDKREYHADFVGDALVGLGWSVIGIGLIGNRYFRT